MRFGFWAARAAALALVLGGCLAADGGAKAPRAQVADAALYQSGLATWYGPGFEGQRTACGYTYSSVEYTAASNTLPCGAVVTVTNLDTGDAVGVTITDRGAFTYPVIVDLSIAAFNAIGDTYHGVIEVAVTQQD
jgi:rare lipoprotein A